MKRTIGMHTIAALLAVATGGAQELKEAAPSGSETVGPRLRVRFVATRQRGEKTTTTPTVLLLHPGEKGASVFVGTQVALRTTDKGAPTVVFKNAGVQVRVTAHVEPDGRYRLDASFEEGAILEAGGSTAARGDNPVLRVVRSESRLVMRAGETIPFADAVDPVTGDVVRIEVALDTPLTARPSGGGANAGLRARFVFKRRQGEKTVAQRPYSVTLPSGDGKAAHVFSGAMLPLEVSHEGRPTVMLKDIGAGLRLEAFRLADGRCRLDLSVSDGTLSSASGSPRVQAMQAESRLYLREGETVVMASAVDPQSGDVVEAEISIEVIR
jgi:Flp pilus assembly secretin CpaC